MQTIGTHRNFSGVQALLDRLVSSATLPCASVLIHQAGRELLYYQAGLSDVASNTALNRDTIFRLFSMTKPITAAATMILVDEGVLRLDDPVTEYIPEFGELGVFIDRHGDLVQTEPARSITIKHLLTHTAGFSYWFYPDLPVGALYAEEPGIGIHERWRFDETLGGLDGLARSLARLPLVAQPGDRWHYSMSLDVAGILVQRASGRTLEAFMKERIFEPLEMHSTGFSVRQNQAAQLASLYGPKSGASVAVAHDAPGVAGVAALGSTGPSEGITLLESGRNSPLLMGVAGAAAGGGLLSTIDDYARFALMLLQGGASQGRRVLSERSTRSMMTNQLQPDQLAELPALAALGLGGTGEGLGFGLGGAVVLHAPSNGIPAFPGEYTWGGGASTTFWIDPQHQLSVVFMTQLQPPSSEMLRDKLHTAIYAAMGLSV